MTCPISSSRTSLSSLSVLFFHANQKVHALMPTFQHRGTLLPQQNGTADGAADRSVEGVAEEEAEQTAEEETAQAPDGSVVGAAEGAAKGAAVATDGKQTTTSTCLFSCCATNQSGRMSSACSGEISFDIHTD